MAEKPGGWRHLISRRMKISAGFSINYLQGLAMSNDLSVQLSLATVANYSPELNPCRFYASYDFGLTWKDLSFKDARYVGDFNFSYSDSDAQYILISGNGTKTLILMPDSSPDMPVPISSLRGGIA